MLRTHRPALLPLLVGTALGALPAAAETPVQLDPIILTGGLTPLPADGYARAHTVLTAEDLDRRGITTVQDALRIVPGLAVSSSGPNFGQLRIRGAEANHTLILIDGIEAAGGADEYLLSGLATDDIDRIEILRGPQSVFYGSNASAGVVNIITDRGAPGLHHGGAAELGNGASASARVSQRGPRGGIALGLSAQDLHGYDISGDGGEKDGLRRKAVGLTADWALSDTLRIGTVLRYADESSDSDATSFVATDADSYIVDDPDLHNRRKEFQGALWAEHALLDGRVVQRLDLQQSVLRASYEGAPFQRGETRQLKYRVSVALDGRAVSEAGHLVNILAERQTDENSQAEDYRREMRSLAVEYRGFLDNGLDVQAGIRHDDNRSFEDFTSWNLGLSWRMPDAPVRLHASAGSALVNPSYYELYADDSYTIGNPGLRPEVNRGFDLGAEIAFLDGRGILDVTYFRERMSDAITYVNGTAPGDRASYANQPGESPREGVEIAGRLQATDELSLTLGYTYLDAEKPDGSTEIRVPRHQLGLSATLAVMGGRGDVTADLRHVSGNADTQFWGSYDTVELPAYTVVNLAAGYDLTRNVRLTGRVTNLFDKAYSDVWGYASQGRTAYLGLQAKW